MNLKTLRNGMDLHGKRVLVRIDANVPVKNGEIVGGTHGKIARVAVDLEWLRQKGARTIVMTHLGRPGGKRVPAYSVQPIAERLSDLLGVKVKCHTGIVGEDVERSVDNLDAGDLMMIENVRFHPGEKENSTDFAKQLAALGDIYINDAFAVCHRGHASISAITDELPSFAGPLVSNEVRVLSGVKQSPDHPFVLLLGGLKMKTKLPVLKKMLPLVDHVLIGGALANAFLKADGKSVSDSVYEEEGVKIAKGLLADWSEKIVLPSDVVTVKKIRKDARKDQVSVNDVGDNKIIVDLGRQTVNTFLDYIDKAETIVWNGPVGYCEKKPFCRGTHKLARGIAVQTGKATTVVGGGDTVPIVEGMELSERFSLVSTGGGAMLTFLADGDMPGLEVLNESK
jgi:phosphoglycerate kinase